MKITYYSSLGVAIVTLVVAGCTGDIGSDTSTGAPSDRDPDGSGVGPSGTDTSGAGPGAGGSSSTTTPGAPAALDNSVGPAALRRLSRLEYNNTVRDLVGDTTLPANKFSGDFNSEHSGFVTGGVVSQVDADRLLEAAESVAGGAVTRLATLVPCNPVPSATAAQDTCARTFIADFNARAFRRPLAPDELASYVGYYTKVRADLKYGFSDAIRMVVQVVLQSPSFLYHWQLGGARPTAQNGVIQLNDHEIASRLSYYLWASMPDKALQAAADAGQLRTIDQVEAQARRMLADAKSRDMLADFQQQWLATTAVAGLKKNTTTYPDFNAAVAASMQAESNALVHHIFGKDGDGALETLLTAPFSFLDANTAKIYQQGGAVGSTLTRVNLDPKQRAGLLTQPAFLAAHATAGGSHPVKRGMQVLEKLLCVELPVPPAVIPEPKPPAPNLSTRERFEVHGSSACAVSCHALIDPLGFAFENYDGVGTYRINDGGKPVNAAGSLTIDGQEVNFANAVELMQVLGTSDEVRSCMTNQFLRYALKRKEVDGDAASLAFARAAFSKSGFDLREALVAATKTKSFFFRKPAAGEVLQ